MGRLTIPLIIAGLLFVAMLQSLFIVEQTQQALVVRFGGDIRRVIQEPGLKAKMPFIDDVVYFDKRLLEFNAQPQEFITKDRQANVEERVVIDAFVRYRIINPVKFYQAVTNEAKLETLLSSIVISSMRKIIAQNSLDDLLSEKRNDIMREIKKAINLQSVSKIDESLADSATNTEQRYGIEVVDVRILRADLPNDISQATYERMRKNFTKEAQKFRAEGEEIALRIRAGADRERTELLAQAKRKSEILRGEGDGEASRIYADAFSRDVEFYEFYRSMQAYREALKADDTTLILSPDSEFLKQLD